MNAYTHPTLSVRIVSFFCTTLLVLILSLALLFAMYIVTPATGEATPVRYTLCISGIDAETADGITVNAPVTDAVTKAPLGVVTEIKRLPYRTEAVKNGVVSVHEDVRRVSLLLTLRADADASDLSVGSIPLLIGKTVYVRLPTYTGASVCIKNTEVLYETTE